MRSRCAVVALVLVALVLGAAPLRAGEPVSRPGGPADLLARIFGSSRSVREAPVPKRASVPSEIQARMVSQALAEWLRFRGQGRAIVTAGRLARPSGTGSISGWLFERDGTTPIQQHPVLVIVYDELGFEVGSDYVSDGALYRIEGLEAGKYYVLATSDHYVDEFYDDSPDAEHATLVQVREGQETRGINFALESLGGGVGAISGKVTNPAGGPPGQGWGVVAFTLSGDFSGVSEVAADGSYLLAPLPAGAYKLLCTYEGPEQPPYAYQWFDDRNLRSEADTVNVVAGETVRGVDFALRQAGTIAGSVLKPDGQPVGEYECYLMAFDADGFSAGHTPSRAGGRFSFSGLPRGDFRVRFEYAGPEQSLMGGWYDGAADFQSASPVPVDFGDTTAIEIVLLKAAAFRGTVLGPGNRPLAWEGEVMVYDEEFDEVGYSQTDENGSYTVARLQPGRYTLYAGFAGMTAAHPLETPAGEWYPGVYDRASAEFVEIESGQTVQIEFALEAGGVIGGHVYDPAGRSVSYSGTVKAFDEEGRPVREGRNANDGIYVVAGLAPGRYKLFFQYEGDQGLADEYYDGQMRLATATWVAVRAGGWTRNVDFTLERPGTVSGLLFGPHGSHLYRDRTLALVYLVDVPSGQVVRSELASLIGGYRIQALSGDYRLAVCTGYRNDFPQPDSLALSFYPGGVSFDDPAAQTLSVQQGEDVRLEDWTLTSAPGAISGTVYDRQHDEPFREGVYVVYAYDRDGHLAKFSAYSSEVGRISGRYRLVGLRPGAYYLLALGAGPSEGLVSSPAVWYGGVPQPLDAPDLDLAGLPVPQGAMPVQVSEGEVRGIDFHLGAATGVVEPRSAANPTDFQLFPAYPNPFNASSVVSFVLPRKGRVTLELFDTRGRRVRTILDEVRTAGRYNVRWNARDLASGVYVLRLQAAGQVAVQKVVLLK